MKLEHLWYKILKINEYASMDDIRKQYHLLILKHHPDKGGDAESFKKINDAYNYRLSISISNKMKGDIDERKISTYNHNVIKEALEILVLNRKNNIKITNNILKQCLKLFNVPSYGMKKDDLIKCIFLRISMHRLKQTLITLSLNTEGTKDELIHRILYSEIIANKSLYLEP